MAKHTMKRKKVVSMETFKGLTLVGQVALAKGHAPAYVTMKHMQTYIKIYSIHRYIHTTYMNVYVIHTYITQAYEI